MGEWTFSWRSIGAALASAVVCGALFGVTLALLDLWLSPDEASGFVGEAGVLALAAAVVLAVFGGALLLIVSWVSRRMPWARPWPEAIIAGAAMLAMTVSGDLLSFTFSTAHGEVPDTHPIAIIGSKLAPTAYAALFPIIYWLLARSSRGVARSKPQS